MENIIYSVKHNLVFISNPKVGCSTIKNSLLNREVDNVHIEVHQSQDFKLPASASCPFFALTRNPYSRALSAYKDKIGKSKNNVWLAFCKKYGFNENDKPSFFEFLTVLTKDANPQDMDPHYRPQVYNLHVEDIVPEFLGRLENMADVSEYLAPKGVLLKTYNKHARNASQTYQQEITPQEEDLINKIYKDDFVKLGYEMSLNSSYVPPSLYNSQQVSERYMALFALNVVGLNADDLRDLAVANENVNIHKAYQLMDLAKLLRPNGPFIVKKHGEYYSKINALE
ncbi:sulfotransferase family 2 domain-containing protein [Vibrio sp. 10N]|uniref:sulfotransferase family 2 domain-containing protein n=1 Tax=Vibrio sp. 10N TaxID=3058938 RepID=UPI0028143C68|nr:hypothetical protein VB10N_29140 [Vibrio sp. 10N]